MKYSEQFCSNCLFWESDFIDKHRHEWGDCHRYPPQVYESACQQQPQTESVEWCGEWKAEETK